MAEMTKKMMQVYDSLAMRRDEARGKTFEEWMYGDQETYEQTVNKRAWLFGEERTKALIDRNREVYRMNRDGYIGSRSNTNTLRALQRRGLVEIVRDVDKALTLGGTVVHIV